MAEDNSTYAGERVGAVTASDLARQVKKVLRLQREYFDTRSMSVLKESKAQEKVLARMADSVLARESAVLAAMQADMFGGGK